MPMYHVYKYSMYYKEIHFFTILKRNKKKGLTKFSAVESAYRSISLNNGSFREI